VQADPRPDDLEARFSTPLLRGALGLARLAHEGPASEGDTELSHPVTVVTLLQEAGLDEEVVAAGLLHDVVEDTSIEIGDISAEFGEPVASLVAAMTERGDVESYGLRKEEHRRRVSQSGGRVAAIYAADKLASAGKLAAEGVEASQQQFEHYERTVGELLQTHPEVPFLGELARALEEVRVER